MKEEREIIRRKHPILKKINFTTRLPTWLINSMTEHKETKGEPFSIQIEVALSKVFKFRKPSKKDLEGDK